MSQGLLSPASRIRRISTLQRASTPPLPNPPPSPPSCSSSGSTSPVQLANHDELHSLATLNLGHNCCDPPAISLKVSPFRRKAQIECELYEAQTALKFQRYSRSRDSSKPSYHPPGTQRKSQIDIDGDISGDSASDEDCHIIRSPQGFVGCALCDGRDPRERFICAATMRCQRRKFLIKDEISASDSPLLPQKSSPFQMGESQIDIANYNVYWWLPENQNNEIGDTYAPAPRKRIIRPRTNELARPKVQAQKNKFHERIKKYNDKK